MCRDGSAAYAEAIRQGAPDAVQVSDRWHLWHGLAAAVEKSVVAHSSPQSAGRAAPSGLHPRSPTLLQRSMQNMVPSISVSIAAEIEGGASRGTA
ncbi:hypothetical protein [Streptosporangium sp. V21-05]|uniref:hypothetical protein n=1 Tax=Streptosporangium sp. V21-05 TaxID=3446115 RepID=UPI003F53D713